MKKIIIIICLLITAVLVTASIPQTIRTLQIKAPIPDRYISSIENSEYVLDVEVDDYITYITINITGLNNNQIDNIRKVYTRLSIHFETLYNSNLMDMIYFENQPLPFACPKDVATGIKTGLYVQNGVIVLDSGDTQGRCP